MIVGLLFFVPAILIGWAVVRIFFPSWPGWMGGLTEISLGMGVGTGIISIVSFAMLWANAGGRVAWISAEAVLAAGGVWLALRRGRVERERAAATQNRSPWIWMLRGAAILALLFFALDAAKSIEANPDGGWDAFAIWNLKAKFLAGDHGAWRTAVAPVARDALSGSSHPGYPLLIPSAVASAWTAEGETASATPAALSVLFAFATAGLLCGAIALLRGQAAGLLALLLLLASEGFVSQAGSQYADIPLSLYFLAGVMLLALAAENGWQTGTLLLAGLCCGLAAWTKNEGLPFLIFAVAAVAWRGGRKALGWMMLGALPVAVLLMAFKFLLVHDVEGIFPRTVGEALATATNVSRWVQIAESFIQSIWQMGTPLAHPVVLAAILAATLGIAPRSMVRKQAWLAIPLAGVLAADFGVYLITTSDLKWHLSTSNLRLMVQVWPALLFLTFLFLSPPVLHEAAVEKQKPVSEKAKRNRSKESRVLHTK
jgi:hypothetical protein